MKPVTRMTGVAIAALAAFGIVSASAATTASPNNNGGSASAQPQVAPLITPSAATPETDYVSLPSCKIVDTRVAGGPIAAGSHRNFHVRGTTLFVTQGGRPGGCGVPHAATAVSFVLHEASTQGDGVSHIWSYGGSVPVSAVLAYTKSQFHAASGDVKLAPIGSPLDISVDAVHHNAHVVIDVTGYYTPQISAVVAAGGGLYTASPRVLSAVRTSAGRYTVTVDRDLTGCTPIASMHGGHFYASAYTSGNTVIGETWAISGGLPVDQDLYWSLAVHC